MKAVIYHDHDEFEKAGPGAVQPCVDLTAILLKCPGCGQPSSMRTYTADQQKPPGPSWELTGLPDAITLKPSINCVGCCGWHGYLTAGEFAKC